MNNARLERSERLQRVRDFLSDGVWHSTRDIVENAHVMAVSAVVSELRANGLRIDCRRDGAAWLYRWDRVPAATIQSATRYSEAA